MQAERVGDNWAENHGNRKGNPEADADKRHRFGAVLLARQVGQQRHYGRGYGAGPL